jgi:aminopeptidase N
VSHCASCDGCGSVVDLRATPPQVRRCPVCDGTGAHSPPDVTTEAIALAQRTTMNAERAQALIHLFGSVERAEEMARFEQSSGFSMLSREAREIFGLWAPKEGGATIRKGRAVGSTSAITAEAFKELMKRRERSRLGATGPNRHERRAHAARARKAKP